MLIEYKEKIKLRINDFDCHDNILFSSVLDLFQDVAGNHATQLGIGFHDLIKKNRIWVIVRNRFEIFKQPRKEEIIIVRTWPLPLGKIDANRCYEIYNENGDLLISGISKWVNADLTTRRIVRMNEIDYGVGEFESDHGLGENFSKLEDFASINESVSIVPTYLDLDHNGHVNNSKYTNFILNSIEELQDKELIYCQIDYIQELKKGEKITLSYTRNDKEFLVKGECDKGISFITKIKIK